MTAIGERPRVEPLASHHDRAGFSCGEPELDRYLREQASQDVRRRLAQVFVATGAAPQAVAGYYSLSAASFSREDLPASTAKRLPRYPVPAAIIGRLAVATQWQGRRLGTFLLLDAAERVIAASRAMAVYAIIVDAKNARAASFYKRFGFIEFPTSLRRLFLPLSDFVGAGVGQ